MTQADELKKLQAENAWLRSENDEKRRELWKCYVREEKLVGALSSVLRIIHTSRLGGKPDGCGINCSIEEALPIIESACETLKSLEISGQSSPDSKTLMTQLDPLNGSDRANIADHDMRIKGVQMTEATKRLLELALEKVRDGKFYDTAEILEEAIALSTSPSDDFPVINRFNDLCEPSTSPSEGEDKKSWDKLTDAEKYWSDPIRYSKEEDPPKPSVAVMKESWVQKRVDDYYLGQHETHSIGDLLDEAWEEALRSLPEETSAVGDKPKIPWFTRCKHGAHICFDCQRDGVQEAPTREEGGGNGKA